MLFHVYGSNAVYQWIAMLAVLAALILLNEFSRRIQERYEYSDRESSDVYMKTPKNRTFTFAMTESNLKAYMDNWYYTGYTVPERTSGTILILLCVVADFSSHSFASGIFNLAYGG